MQILNVTTGGSLTTPFPGSRPATLTASLSADGTLLAALLKGGALGVLDTATGALTRDTRNRHPQPHEPDVRLARPEPPAHGHRNVQWSYGYPVRLLATRRHPPVGCYRNDR